MNRERFLDLCVVAGVLTAYFFHVYLFRDYFNDDAYITFRYSRFLAEGLGPYYNAGEHVEGYTNFLLMLLLSLVYQVGGAEMVPLTAKWIGVAAGAGAVLCAYTLCRVYADCPIKGRIAGLIAAGVVVASPAFVLNAQSGLETILFAALIALAVALGAWADQANRWRGAGIAFAAAALTRPEGALLFGPYCIGVLLVARAQPGAIRRLTCDAAIVIATVAAHLAFRMATYDGEWLPNTYYAKLGGMQNIGKLDYVLAGSVLPLGGWLPFAAGLAGSIFLPARTLPLACVAVAGALSPFATGTDWMVGSRLLMPYLPLLAVLFALGWVAILSRMRAPTLLAAPVAAALIVFVWSSQSGQRSFLREFVARSAQSERSGHGGLAGWLSARAGAGDTVALMDIGLVGYRCADQRILDISGLTDRFIGKGAGAFLGKEYDPGYVLDQSPEFIVIVFWQPGDSTKPPSRLEARPWTRAEDNLYFHPEFARWYRGAAPRASADWLDEIAGILGAERVFLHPYTDRYYFLAVFERKAVAHS